MAPLSPSTLLEAAAEGQAPRSSFAISERSDWSRYSDGRYVEHVYRESRSWCSGSLTEPLRGEVYAMEGSVQGPASSAREVLGDSAVELGLGRFGAVARSTGGAFPSHRGLLSGAPERLEEGGTWIGEAELAFRPGEGRAAGLIRVLVEYKVGAQGLYGGRPVTTITALFAPRWNSAVSRNASLEAAGIRSVNGRHQLDLYLDSGDGTLVFVRDRFDDTVLFASGPSERRSGFILLFAQGTRAQDRKAEIAAIASAGALPGGSASVPGSAGTASGAPSTAPAAAPAVPAAPVARAAPAVPAVPAAPETPAAPVAPAASGPAAAGLQGSADSLPSATAGPGALDPGTDDGLDETPSPALAAAGVELISTGDNLVLRVRDLRFVPDGDAILPGEEWRLDAIYDALAALPGRSFLVEGHAAGVGKPAGELELSKRRAKRVVDELVARGIAAGRLIWRGLGSTRPLAPNDSEEGRARNRRVEITVLE